MMVGKRKRSDEDGGAENTTVNGNIVNRQEGAVHEWLTDALEVLRGYDTTPSTFTIPITSSEDSTPSVKRAKHEHDLEPSSIESLVSSKAYDAVEPFVTDVATATARVLDNLHKQVEDGDGSPKEILRQTTLASRLKDRLEALLVGDMLQRPKQIKLRREEDHQASDDKVIKTEALESNKRDKTILTLCGGDREAKRLFSSLRETESDLNELALPNGITTTEVLPTHSLNEPKKQKHPPTFGSVFLPPTSIRPLNPPRQPSKHTATKSSSVNWYKPSDVAPSKESTARDGYTRQPLSVGQWLTYNVPPSATQLTSPEAKRKQRDRALSFGEPQSLLSEETIAIHNQAKEEALFRSAYSSFAPDRDDSGALVPEQQKNRMWWAKHGELQYDALLDIKNSDLLDSWDPEEFTEETENGFDEEVIEAAIENWQPIDPGIEIQDENISGKTSDKDADELLAEISDLMETLSSHQRIRNLSLSNSRTMPGQAPQLASMSGSPSTPSSAELVVYETLKSQLALIVSTLPPYMLSKLDGDKLGELKISTRVHVEGRNPKGTMEDDEHSARIKPAPAARVPAPISTPSTTTPYTSMPPRTSSYTQGSATPGQQYNRSAYNHNTVPKPTPNPSAYPATQYPGRPTPSAQYPPSRPSYGPQGSFPPQRTPSSSYTDRYTNGVASQMLQPQTYSQYPNGFRPSLGQHTNSYGQQYSTPQSRGAAASTYRPPVPQTEYAQRAPPPPAYNYGAVQPGASRSPHQQQHPRPPYAGQGQAQTPSQRPQLYHQHSSHYGSQASAAEPPTNGAAADTGSGRMSPDEQTAVMARQKAQLAGQQQAPISRPGSSTPQPPAPQPAVHGHYDQRNGTPTTQQNGIAAN